MQVQSWLQASNNTGILNTCTSLWLTGSEQATLVDLIKDVARSSVKVPEFKKHMKMAGGHIGRNVLEITIKMKTIVRKLLMIKIIALHLRKSLSFVSEMKTTNTIIYIYIYIYTQESTKMYLKPISIETISRLNKQRIKELATFSLL